MNTNLVIKHNDLIEARYDLDLIEQKIILYAVSCLDTSKEGFKIIKIHISNLAGLMESKTGRYTEFREIANNLMDKKVYLKDRPNLDVRWLASSEYVGGGIIELEFSEKLIPYLLQLKEKFTRYQVENILYLKNKYSIRIYELLKQYEKIKQRAFSVENFKKYLMLEGQYDRFYDLERRVIIPCLKEINELTDLRIDYKKERKGKTVVKLVFVIESDLVDYKIKYLNECYDINALKKKMGVEEEKFNAKQIIELYEMAILKVGQTDMDVFEYININYSEMLRNNAVRNKFSYLLKSLENDFAYATVQLKYNKQ